MQTFIIGTDGNQPFKIASSMVSREHAKVTIDDKGQWTIEDLNSTNGTFVRDETGRLVRVSMMPITPETFICLGPDTALGCKFYACHLIAEDGDYSHEFSLLKKFSKEYSEKIARVERTSEMVTKSIGSISLVLLAGSFLIADQGTNVQLLRVGTALSTCSSLLYSPRKTIKKLSTHYTELFKCPNPNCNSKLSQKEIDDCQCVKCKAHA